jgi:sugar phosphate isomerase/epimerase
MKPFLSCADYTFPLLGQEEAFALIRLLGFGYVDLGVFAGRSHLQPASIATNIQAAADQISKRLQRNNLLAADVFLQTHPDYQIDSANDPNPDVRDRNRILFDAIAKFSQLIGAAHITGLPGVWHEKSDDEKSWRYAIEEAAWRKEQASKLGITYAIEPHIGSICDNPETAHRFATESGCGITLDYGHFTFQGIAPKEVDILIPQCSHFHARGASMGRLQTPISESAIDFPSVLQKLIDAGFQNGICIEYVWVDWMDCNRCDNISETVLLEKMLSAALEHGRYEK